MGVSKEALILDLRRKSKGREKINVSGIESFKFVVKTFESKEFGKLDKVNGVGGVNGLDRLNEINGFRGVGNLMNDNNNIYENKGKNKENSNICSSRSEVSSEEYGSFNEFDGILGDIWFAEFDFPVDLMSFKKIVLETVYQIKPELKGRTRFSTKLRTILSVPTNNSRENEVDDYYPMNSQYDFGAYNVPRKRNVIQPSLTLPSVSLEIPDSRLVSNDKEAVSASLSGSEVELELNGEQQSNKESKNNDYQKNDENICMNGYNYNSIDNNNIYENKGKNKENSNYNKKINKHEDRNNIRDNKENENKSKINKKINKDKDNSDSNLNFNSISEYKVGREKRPIECMDLIEERGQTDPRESVEHMKQIGHIEDIKYVEQKNHKEPTRVTQPSTSSLRSRQMYRSQKKSRSNRYIDDSDSTWVVSDEEYEEDEEVGLEDEDEEVEIEIENYQNNRSHKEARQKIEKERNNIRDNERIIEIENEDKNNEKKKKRLKSNCINKSDKSKRIIEIEDEDGLINGGGIEHDYKEEVASRKWKKDDSDEEWIPEEELEDEELEEDYSGNEYKFKDEEDGGTRDYRDNGYDRYKDEEYSNEKEEYVRRLTSSRKRKYNTRRSTRMSKTKRNNERIIEIENEDKNNEKKKKRLKSNGIDRKEDMGDLRNHNDRLNQLHENKHEDRNNKEIIDVIDITDDEEEEDEREIEYENQDGNKNKNSNVNNKNNLEDLKKLKELKELRDLMNFRSLMDLTTWRNFSSSVDPKILRKNVDNVPEKFSEELPKKLIEFPNFNQIQNFQFNTGMSLSGINDDLLSLKNIRAKKTKVENKNIRDKIIVNKNIKVNNKSKSKLNRTNKTLINEEMRRAPFVKKIRYRKKKSFLLKLNELMDQLTSEEIIKRKAEIACDIYHGPRLNTDQTDFTHIYRGNMCDFLEKPRVTIKGHGLYLKQKMLGTPLDVESTLRNAFRIPETEYQRINNREIIKKMLRNY